MARNPIRLETVEQWNDFREKNKNGLLLFKLSPTCPVSLQAEWNIDRWLEQVAPAAMPPAARVDVIGARALSSQIAQDLGVAHQSPQAILLGPDGEVAWSASHFSITMDALNEHVPG